MTVDTTLRIRPYSAADEPAVLALLDAALQGGPTGRRTSAFFRWKHEQNPFGESLRLVAEHAGEVIGFRTFLRWHFATDSGTVHAVRAVDTATHPRHQGKGVFRRLTLEALEELRGTVDLVFNTPNGRSGPGYLKMGWSRVGTVPVAVRPVRPLRLVRYRHAARTGQGAPSGGTPPCSLPAAGAALSDGAAVDELLRATETAPGTLRTARTTAYLRWRYADAPDLSYRAVEVRESGTLTGLAIGRPRHRGPLREFLLSELLVRPGDRGTARALLRAVRHAGCDHIAAHLPDGSAAAQAARTSGYLPAPGAGIDLVANPLSPDAEGALRLSSWRFSLGDLELF